MQRCDVAVIGLGIVGTSALHALTRAGLRAVGVDPGAPGGGTSSRSFAWVNAVRKEPDAYHRLNAAGLAAHRQLAHELGGEAAYHAGGSLEWAVDGTDADELRARVDRLAARGYPAAWIGADEARGMEPGLAIPDRVRTVAYYASDGWLDAPALIGRLLAAAAPRADIRRGAAALSVVDGRAEAIAGGEVIAATTVLLCVGPATRRFLNQHGLELPVDRVPGLLALTSPPAAPLHRVVHAPGIHLRPDPTGGLVLGATDLDGLITEDSSPAAAAGVAEQLLARAGRMFPPARGVRLIESRIGVRPMPADGHTIAGRLPGVDNLWVLATHSGVTLGPLLGGLIAGELAGGPPSALLAPFRPERFTEPARSAPGR
jgi:glycine/D-amino acid oxidase-like deaminating enzyme